MTFTLTRRTTEATPEQVEAEYEQMRAVIEQIAAEMSTILGKPVALQDLSQEMRKIFDKVADCRDWKVSIDRTVYLTDAEKTAVNMAVEYFTGSVPTFEPLPGVKRAGRCRYRVRAAGYYLTTGS